MRIFFWLIGIVVVGTAAVAGFLYWQGKPLTATSVGDSIEQVLNQQNLSSYTSDAYGFSFMYPPLYTVGSFERDGGDTFIIQNDQGVGMQLVVTPFDEDVEKLTPERIKKDLPDMPMSDVREVPLPKAGFPAVVFKSSGNGFAESIELWFVAQGSLYQASAPIEQMSFLESVMGSFTLPN